MNKNFVNSVRATVKERYRLNTGSEKETYHLVLSLEGSDIAYSVGDCLGIYPENEPSEVVTVLARWNAHGSEMIEDRQGTLYSLGLFLKQHANLAREPKEPPSTLHAYCKSLSPLLPRFYSIASSMQVVGAEAHLTVGLIDGLCTHFLCKRLSVGERVSIFHKPARHFSLPSSHDLPIIMIGPGTGVAPFRGFLQERIAQNGSPKNWLFFGERYRQTDFLYQSYWEELITQGKLRLDCAFSRDQAEKVYVQHLMLQQARDLWAWIQEGAYLYVCGDASRMAKDVDKTLHTIAEKEGSLSPDAAKAFIKALKNEGRYQRDVY